jgi:hypothetical protein
VATKASTGAAEVKKRARQLFVFTVRLAMSD